MCCKMNQNVTINVKTKQSMNMIHYIRVNISTKYMVLKLQKGQSICANIGNYCI